MDIILYVIYYIVIVIAACYIIYFCYQIKRLLKELDHQIILNKNIGKENIAIKAELRKIKSEHEKEIQALNEVVRKQEEYVYDLEQKLKKGTKTTKTKKETTKKTTKTNKK